jgi:hypothetical protein
MRRRNRRELDDFESLAPHPPGGGELAQAARGEAELVERLDVGRVADFEIEAAGSLPHSSICSCRRISEPARCTSCQRARRFLSSSAASARIEMRAEQLAAVTRSREETSPCSPSSSKKHCESGDVLIDTVALADPQRGDLPTRLRWRRTTTSCRGPRPSSSRNGDARVIRRRETLDRLLSLEI